MRPLGPGDEIAGYRIEALAGRGGMGLVYRARQRRPDRTVAIKVIAPELAADPSFRARFEQESATAAQIEHPNVIPVYEVGEVDGQLFISMRFVQGVDLGRLLALQGRLDPRRAAAIISQAAAALDAAHAQGLVHRDVKPGNILLTADGHVYLTDFGLTKRTADSQGMTRAGMYVGTVDYIAPEQVEGRRVDARADVYALGCVTYEVLSGSVPFPRDSDIAKIFAHVNDPPPRLEGVPEPLADAVQRAMAKHREDRFQSAGDFGRAVGAGALGEVARGGDRTVATGKAGFRETPVPTERTEQTPVPTERTEQTPVATERTEQTPVPPSEPDDATEVEAPTPVPRSDPDDATELEAPTPVPERARPDRAAPPTAAPPLHQRRRTLAAGLAALVVLIGAGVAIAVAAGGSGSATTTTTTTTTSNTSTSSTATPTAKQIYSPANASGGLAVANPNTARGSCFTGSNVILRADAYRCSAGNSIYDPCFSINQTQVLCPTDGPWANTGTLINTSGGLVSSGQDQGTRGQPWAIQMADGTRCLAVSGATNEVAGQRLGYFCKHGIGLYGNVQRSAPVWTIFVGTPHSATLAQRPIVVAWF